MLGVHLEGPFISPRRLGAHVASARRDPDLALLDRLLDGGPVRLMTLAPELPGADALIDRLFERGVVVSLGHSDASAGQANAAFDRGVRTVTHVFNAMAPLHHRNPGLVGAALARDDVVVQMILDGITSPRDRARRLERGRAKDRARHGRDHRRRPRRRLVQHRQPRRRGARTACRATRTGRSPGTVLTMIEAVQNLHRLGAPLLDAVEAATAVPARVLGHPEVGRLAVGLPADVVVVDDRLELVRVLVGGDTRVAT